MKIWRNIWVILLLIIVLVGVPYLWMNWEDVQKQVAALTAQPTAEKTTGNSGETGEQKQKTEVAEKSDKKAVEKQTAVKAEKKSDSIEPVFEGADIRTGKQGRLTGFAPKGWGVRIKRGERVIAETSANKDDGRWVIILDKNALPKGRSVLTMEIVSPGNKLRAMAGQKLELMVPASPDSAVEVVRLEKGKEPFTIQKAEVKPVKPKAADAGGDKTKTAKTETENKVVAKKADEKGGDKAKEENKAPVKTRGGLKAASDDSAQPKAGLLVIGDIKFNNSSARGGKLELNGEGLPGNRLRIYLSGKELGTAKVNSDGKWQFSKSVSTSGGKASVKIEQIDQQGAVVAVKEQAYDLPILTAAVKNKAKKVAPEKTSAKKAETKSAAKEKAAVVERREEKVEIKEAASRDSKSNEAGIKNGEADKAASKVVKHTVVRGDTLWGIAVKHYGDGVSYWKIYRRNKRKIKKPDLIYPGQNFVIP